MRFQWPILLWGVALVPALAVVYVIVEMKRRRQAHAFATQPMLPNVVAARPGWRRHVPPALLLLAVAVLLVGMARPEAALSVPRERATIVLVIDSSHSMRSADIEPNRLAAATNAARRFVGTIPKTFQVGVVTFGRRARVLNAPTIDRTAVKEALDSIETSEGTVLGDGLARAVETRRLVTEDGSEDPAPMVVLLLSDGNDTGSEVAPADAANSAREQGIKVHTIAFGVGEGIGPLGKRYRSPDVAMLRNIAGITGGRFFLTPSAEDLNEVFSALGSSVGRVREHREITVAFVGGGTLLLALAGVASAVWFKRLP
jgi:Ca-activated chloride channel homolog